jgi:pimeloyl-ACP methyl ester carboxylesterase
VPELSRPDGSRIHYEVQGDDGPTIVLATYWSWNPGIWGELFSDLAADHRVVTYHLRGTGESSREGPFDMETDGADLEEVAEAAGGPTVLLATADSANRAATVGMRRDDLVHAVVSFGAGPFALATFEGQEAMLASNSVVGALVEMLERNYRGALRTLTEATNPQMSEEELRERVDAQARFCGQDAAVDRLKSWIADDPREESRLLGERLWIFTAPEVAGPWLPPWEVRKRLTAEAMPEARVVEFEGDTGPISRPHETAEAIRQITAPLRSGAAQSRK